MAAMHHTNALNGWLTRVTCGRGAFSRAGGSHLATTVRADVECKRCIAALAKQDERAAKKAARACPAAEHDDTNAECVCSRSLRIR